MMNCIVYPFIKSGSIILQNVIVLALLTINYNIFKIMFLIVVTDYADINLRDRTTLVNL